MKKAVRFLVGIGLALVLLLPVLSVAAAGQDLHYGKGNDTDRTFYADELFDLLFGEEVALTDFERAYLRARNMFSLSYSTAGLSEWLISSTYDKTAGTLTISALPFSYSAQNGEEIVWIPQTVCKANGQAQPLVKSGNAYSYTYSDLWHSDTVEVCVNYAWSVVLSAETADTILTGAFPEAKALREKLDAHADWEAREALYNAYCQALEKYQKDYTRWQTQQLAYNNYLSARAQYEQNMEAYLVLSAAWEQYDQYGIDFANYLAAKDEYNTNVQTMKTIDSCLAIMEVMFTPTTDGNDWCFYPSLMGGTVDTVLSSSMTYAGISQKDTVKPAKQATKNVRDLLTRYANARSAHYSSEFEKKQALFAVYSEIYVDLCENMWTLYDKINSIYGVAGVRQYMGVNYLEKVPHFQQFLAQLYVLQALLRDSGGTHTVDLSLELPMQYPQTTKKKIGDLVEPALRPADTDSAAPGGIFCPAAEPVEPVAPTVVPQPEEARPTQAPTPPQEVSQPVKPQEPDPVEAPGNEPENPELTEREQELVAQYDAGLLPERTARGSAQTLTLTQTVTKTVTYQNKRTVIFYQADGTELQRTGLEYQTVPESSPVLDDYQTTQYDYTFCGWATHGSTEPLDLTKEITEDLSLYPVFSRKDREYTVTWDPDYEGAEEIKIPVAYGQTPQKPADPTRPDDETYFYLFAGWNATIGPVTGEKTYTAIWNRFPLFCAVTWDLGYDGAPEEDPVWVAYGEKPAHTDPDRPADAQYTYTFAGWSPAVVNATEDITYQAIWTPVLRSYPVTWNLDNGSENEQQTLSYGTIPTHGVPTRKADAQFTYDFAGWRKDNGETVIPKGTSLDAVTGSVTYTAVWQTTTRSYTVTWKNGYDGGTVYEEVLSFGTTPQKPANPNRPANAQYTYTFASWSPEIQTVSGEVTYTAIWVATVNQYTVTWDLGHGEPILQLLDYGANIAPTVPESWQDEQYCYDFIGWSPALAATVTKNVTYTAQWNRSDRLYTVTWMDGYGGTLGTTQVKWEQMPSYAAPTRPSSNDTDYTFAGWSPTVAAVAGNATYTAQWELSDRLYTITWMDGYGGTLGTTQVKWNQTPSYADPTRPSSVSTDYAFAGWSPAVAVVSGNAAYTAQWDETPRAYTVTWMDGYGGTLGTTQVAFGTVPAHADPTRASSVSTDYTFAGWSPTLTAVTGTATYTAQWTESPRKYQITWDLNNGTPVADPVEYEYNTVPQYTGTLTKDKDEEFEYAFAGWSPAVAAVTGDATYVAQWTPSHNIYQIKWDLGTGEPATVVPVEHGTPLQYPGTPQRGSTVSTDYTFAGWEDENHNPLPATATVNATYFAKWKESVRNYTVTWKNHNGETLGTDTVAYGTAPVYHGTTPVRDADAQYTYTFEGQWSPQIVPVQKDATYTAVFTETLNQYTVTWKNGEDTIYTETLDYGAVPVYDQDTHGVPAKAQTAQYTYTFEGQWSPQIVPVQKDATYTAVFTETLNQYTVTWKNGEDAIYTETLDYGAVPVYDQNTHGVPAKAQTAQYTYTFEGQWSPQIVPVQEDAAYTAVFAETVNQYTVTWNLDNGAAPVSNRYDYGEIPAFGTTFHKAETPAYTYEFAGWKKDSGETVIPKEDTLDEVTANVTYTASWIPHLRSYTITWMDGYGGTIDTTTVQWNETPSHEDPTRPNSANGQYSYTFAGWSPEVVAVDGEKTYTATWTPHWCSYTITWMNGYGGIIDTTEVAWGETPAFADPTREPAVDTVYTFAGWSPEIVSVAGEKTYTATWAESTRAYTVTWENGYNGGILKQEELLYGATPQKPADPSREPTVDTVYTFAGWDLDIVSVTGEKTYTATWAESTREYTVTWNFGYDGAGEDTTLVAYGDQPSYEGIPEREQDEQFVYTFAGWDKAFEQVTGNQTYTALWSHVAREYKITWVLYDDVTDTTEVAWGETPAHSAPTRAANQQYTYTFIGWGEAIVPVTGEKVYSAQWDATLNQYTVTWDLGYGVPTTEKIAYGTLPARDDPARESTAQYDYNFAGWDKAFVEVTENVTYTASWTPVLRFYTVTWNFGYDGAGEETISVAYGNQPSYQATPVRAQDERFTYVFAGWKKGESTVAISPGTALDPVTGNQTYTASWTPIRRFFAITWDLNYGGKTIVEQVANGATPTPADPTRPADEQYLYTFAGWSPAILPATRDTAYTAKWERTPQQVQDTKGNSYQIEVAGETVTVKVEQEDQHSKNTVELDLKTVIEFAADDEKTITLERDNAAVKLEAKSLQEQLPGLGGVLWNKNEEEQTFRLDFVDDEGNGMETELSYQIELSYEENQIITLYYEEESDGTQQEIQGYSVGATGRLAYNIQAGKTVVCKIRYKLSYTASGGAYYSKLAASAEAGEWVFLDAECDYGYEVSGATLTHEDGSTEEVGQLFFTMPAESLNVELHITPIVYHVVFVCRGNIISEKDYNFGEPIEVPENPSLPDEGEIRYEFSKWSPQVSETATGKDRELIYEAFFSIGSSTPKEAGKISVWRFIFSPVFLGAMAILVIFVGGIVWIILRVKKVRRRKRAMKNMEKEAAALESARMGTDKKD